jgi:MSHA biogenesis protein MshJ
MTRTLRPSGLSAQWQSLDRRYQALNPRERMLVALCCTVVVGMAIDKLWVTPAWTAWSQARQVRQQSAQVLQTLDASLATLRQRKDLDTRQLQAELAALQARTAQADAQGRTSDLVSPAEMLPLLEQLLGRHSGLKLRSLQSLGRTALGPGTPILYRHGVELTVEGRYIDLLDYLKTLEASPQRVLWGSLQLKVIQHPQVLLTLRLHTLSTDAHWVEI